jgi:AsmA protein
MRWIIRIAAFIAIVVVLGLGALVAVPTERVAAVADRLSAATGREVAMEGELRPTLFPSLGIRVGDVRIGNPDWVDAGPMIAAERLDVSVEWAPLLRGEIRLDRAEFVSPQITLVRAADGRVSWDFGPRTARRCTRDDSGPRMRRLRRGLSSSASTAPRSATGPCAGSIRPPAIPSQ